MAVPFYYWVVIHCKGCNLLEIFQYHNPCCHQPFLPCVTLLNSVVDFQEHCRNHPSQHEEENRSQAGEFWARSKVLCTFFSAQQEPRGWLGNAIVLRKKNKQVWEASIRKLLMQDFRCCKNAGLFRDENENRERK